MLIILVEINSLKRLIDFNFLHPLNIWDISVVEYILNSDKFKYNKDSQLENILLIFLILFPLNSLNSIQFKFLQLWNIP